MDTQLTRSEYFYLKNLVSQARSENNNTPASGVNLIQLYGKLNLLWTNSPRPR